MKDLEDLAQILASRRTDGKKIVHCHGVFDPLHIGHIRHFEQAKRLGDILVVSVTPDRYVNKGPHRPVFTEKLRVEAIASLECVDYVAVNTWPMAAETIRLLRPDFYVKGAEYRDAEKDRTGGIGLEEAAVHAVGGQLTFTDEVTFSGSRLVNRHLSVFPKAVSDYLTSFSERFRVDDVLGYLDQARRLRVLVVGEAIVDEYQYCEAIGKSAKEPTLAVKRLSIEKFPGGILAVGNHVANFCDQVGLVTFLGAVESQEQFVRQNLNVAIDALFLSRKQSPTIVKRRFVESYFFTKLLEVYELNDGLLDEAENASLCNALRDRVPEYDVVIVVDFGHGMLSGEAIEILCRQARFLAVNAQSNAGNLGYHTVSRYPRADYVCLSEGEVRLEARDRRGDLKTMVLEVSRRLGCERVVVTRGKYGCLSYAADEGFVEVPAFAGQVVDRMGAGDAFLSITALCAAQGAAMEVVGFIGNAVGAQAVATVGHRSSVEPVPLFEHIASLMK